MKESPEGLTAPGRLLFVYLPDLLDDQTEERTARRCGSCTELYSVVQELYRNAD